MRIGEKIRELRKSQRLTQRELAERVGVSKLTIWRWEKGRAIPREHARLLAETFSVSFDMLVNDAVGLLPTKDDREHCAAIESAGTIIAELMGKNPDIGRAFRSVCSDWNILSEKEIETLAAEVHLSLLRIEVKIEERENNGRL